MPFSFKAGRGGASVVFVAVQTMLLDHLGCCQRCCDGRIANVWLRLDQNFATAGVHNPTAAYSGDSFFNASSSGVYVENVLLNSTAIAASGTPNPAVVFQVISFTAQVTSATGYVATGTVTFLANGTEMGTGTLQSGKAFFSTSSLAVGTYAITASYGGQAALIQRCWARP